MLPGLILKKGYKQVFVWWNYLYTNFQILGEMNMDRLNEEFINYQLLSSQDLPSSLCADSSP